MEEEHIYCLIAFDGALGAVQARRTLEGAGLTAHIMPTPREISVSCGLSVRLPPEEYPQARAALESCRGDCRFYRMAYGPGSRSLTPLPHT
ncbi:hypothetical protein B5G43_01960 [Flavonifractor sp. An92]|uniref:DUF3343 domain-containing protein n=1 Tax=Flavonifractor sp. An92 TaxID=1965666 RepID=UPI000B38CD35|nr:DUF3343 domain-containing protein [Flavonifractor sp. An92]OUN08169.1 hypothetical protein B5G43_01960 [Flavonifractor sp. An92]